MEKRELKHFPFYRSYAEALKDLPDEERLDLLDGIINFAFYEEEYEPKTNNTRMIFTLIKPILETTLRKILGGKKGGRKNNRPDE